MIVTASEESATQLFPLALRVKELEEQLSTVHVSLICAFNQILDLKDLNTGVHSTRLAEWAVRVAEDLEIDEACLHDIEVAALLHDIGKVGVPDAILQKPSRLTDQEYELTKKHPEYGWAIVRLFPDLERAGLLILHHHERYDGGGYPGGLKNQEIPIGARIVSVIDAFDAMISARPYRAGLPCDEALRRLIAASGTQFDPAVVRCFVRIAEADIPAVFAATGTCSSVVL
ncbi:MAG TPA: HD-GYP domain-containing protein [Acidobacteriota bacterium]|jgi:HD-GYP domain-containing protein (c-di-GMP phosphodiesterase class II)